MTIRTILVGINGSEGADHAAQWTASVAAALGANVVACYVYEPLDHLDEISPGTDFVDVADLLREKLAGPWTQIFRDAGVQVSSEIVEGVPTHALASAAERANADLVVVGARGHRRRRHPFGSTAAAMADATRVPVTIIRPDADTDE